MNFSSLARLIGCGTVGLLPFCLAFPAHAEGPDESSQDASSDDGIVVTAHSLRDLGLMAGSVELGGDKLIAVMAPQIGDVLAKLPGVSATSFAPGASRPVLRGLTGDRVQVLVDGIGSIDVSSVSADHGVALDTLTIDHIDVLHGPAVLAFGGQAIGGAVNAFDKRIPRHVPADGYDLTALAGVSRIAGGKNVGGAVDLALGSRWVLHGDASWHDSADLRVGGDVLSPPLKAEVLGLAADARADGEIGTAEELEALAAARGRVANSFAGGSTLGAGLAFIDEGGSLGVSVRRIANRYGIPGRPGVGEEGVSIDMGQTRFDLRGEVKLSGFFESLHIRGAYADYTHAELEDGEVGTRFDRQGIETRLELLQADHDGWKGMSGVHFSWGKLAVTGDEAILPANQDERLGFFTLQQVKLGRVELEAAGRIERVRVQAGSAGFDRTFTLASGAAGIAFRPVDGLKLGLNYSHGERAPSPEELLTDGLHVATQAYEIGNPAFGREKSNGVEAYVSYDSERTKLSATAYRTTFGGFIAPLPTGAVIDGFPVYAYRQLPARFTGFEAQASQVMAKWDDSSLTLDAGADYVHAQLKGIGPVPRIPPLRIRGGFEYARPGLTIRGEVEWNAAQKRVGAFEYPTPAFALVNLSATWKPMGEDGPLTLILAADNLFDAVGRRAASFTRDYIPVAGRDIRLTAKLSL